MFNLIRKDIIIHKFTLMILIPVLLVYLMMDISSVWLGFLISIAIIMTTFAADEKSSINKFLNALPYTRKEIVSSKYIGALIFTFIVVCSIFIGTFIIHREILDWEEMMLVVSLILIFVSFAFPFSYKFKSQYLMTGSAIIFVALMVIFNFIIPKVVPMLEDKMNLEEKVHLLIQKLFSLQDMQLYGLIAIVIIVLYGCSWLLSIRIYSKKVF